MKLVEDLRQANLAFAIALALLAPAAAAAGSTLLRVPAATLDALPEHVRVIDRHGEIAVVEVAADGAADLADAVPLVDGYRLALPGLPAADPLTRAPGPELATADPERPAIGLVQFRGPTKAEWLAALEAAASPSRSTSIPSRTSCGRRRPR